MSPRPIRIGFVLTELLGGGAERSMLGIIDALDRTRFEPVLIVFQERHGHAPPADARVILNSRGQPLGANGVAQWFLRLYRGLGFTGCSSHSGRRTAITNWARKITAAGGSLRDVQSLAGHASLADTQRYIDQSPEAKRRVVAM